MSIVKDSIIEKLWEANSVFETEEAAYLSELIGKDKDVKDKTGVYNYNHDAEELSHGIGFETPEALIKYEKFIHMQLRGIFEEKTPKSLYIEKIEKILLSDVLGRRVLIYEFIKRLK